MAEEAVYRATARYIVEHYAPDPARDEPFGVVCLAAGRRHEVPVGQQERGEEWNPSGPLLRSLEGLPSPVAPVSECRWNRRLEEVHLPSGRRAVVVALSLPRWDSETTAWVDVRSRESQRWAFRYRCHLLWRIDHWAVRSCL